MPVSSLPTTCNCTERAHVAGVGWQPASPTAAAMLHSSGVTLSGRSRFNERWATLSKDAFQQIVNATLAQMTTLPTTSHASADRSGLPANRCAVSTRADVTACSPSPARLNSQPLVQNNSPGGALFQEKSGGNDCIQTEIIGSYAAAASQMSGGRWTVVSGCCSALTNDCLKADNRLKEKGQSGRRQRKLSGYRRGLRVTPATERSEGGVIARFDVAVTAAVATVKSEHKYSGKGDSVCDDWSEQVVDAPTDIRRAGRGRGRVCAHTATTAASVAAAGTAVVGVSESGESHTPPHRPILEASSDRGIDSRGCDGGMAAASPQCMKCAPVVTDLDEAVAARRRQDAHQWVRLSKSTLFSLVEELVAATAEERDTRADGGHVSPRQAHTPPTRCADRRRSSVVEEKCRETAEDLCRDLRASESGALGSPTIGVARLSFVKQEVAVSPSEVSAMGRTQSKECWAAVNKTVVFTVVEQAIQSECRGTLHVPAAASAPCMYFNGVHESPSVHSQPDHSSVLDLSSKENIQKSTDERSTNLLSQSDKPPRFNGNDARHPWKPHSKRHTTDGKDAEGSRRGKKRKRGTVEKLIRNWSENEDKTTRGEETEKSPSPFAVLLRNSEAESTTLSVTPGSVDVNCSLRQTRKPTEVLVSTEVGESGADVAAIRQAATQQRAPSSPRALAPTDSTDGDGDSVARPTQLVCVGSPPNSHAEPRQCRDSPKLGWVAVSKDEVHTIVDTVVSTMMSPGDATAPSCPACTSTSSECRSPSPAGSSSRTVDSLSPKPNIPRHRTCRQRSLTDNSRQTGNDLEIGGLAIYSEGEEDKAESKYAGSPATDSDPDSSPLSADTDTGGDCSPKRGFKWKSNLLMRCREERKSAGSDARRVETPIHGDCERSKHS